MRTTALAGTCAALVVTLACAGCGAVTGLEVTGGGAAGGGGHLATSTDGVTFGAPSTLATSYMLHALSIPPAPAGAAVAWSASFQEPDHSDLHLAVAGEDGAPVVADTALTHHKRYVYDVGLAYDQYDDGGTQIYLRQLDGTGADLFGAFQVSHATYLEYGCCTDTRHATLATDGDGRSLVLWSEVEARPAGDSAFSLKAALLDCATRG
jgi:hypothetical protein